MLPSLVLQHQLNLLSLMLNILALLLLLLVHVILGQTNGRLLVTKHHSVFVVSIWDKLVFSNGLFYCLSVTGWLGLYDPLECTWRVLEIPPPKCPVENFIIKNWQKGKFITAHEGNIFVIHICCGEDPIIFKLD
jgi:hypothetical protein